MEWADKYIGIPYLYLGRDWAHADCWGLIRLIYRTELQIELPSLLDHFSPEFDRKEAMDIMRMIPLYTNAVPRDQVKPLDIVTFRIGEWASHCGVVVSEGRMLHTRQSTNACLERYTSLRWKDRVEGFYRYSPEIELPSD